jgi:hypothetical protein
VEEGSREGTQAYQVSGSICVSSWVLEQAIPYGFSLYLFIHLKHFSKNFEWLKGVQGNGWGGN